MLKQSSKLQSGKKNLVLLIFATFNKLFFKVHLLYNSQKSIEVKMTQKKLLLKTLAQKTLYFKTSSTILRIHKKSQEKLFIKSCKT